MQLVQETWVGSLDQEDPLEKEMATHSSILAWEILWTGAQQATNRRVTKSQTQLNTWPHDSWQIPITWISDKKKYKAV